MHVILLIDKIDNMAKTRNPKRVNDLPPRVEGELLTNKDNNPIDAWRIFKIMSEFVEGFELLRKYGKAATFFGSARSGLDDEKYKEANELAARLSKDDFAIITGGGPGIMEAANRGAFDAGGKSVGLNIELPMEQRLNSAVNESIDFHYFFTRKVMLTFASDVYIYFPGGFGTLDEFFEIITLVQNKKIDKIPIILYGKEFWEPLTSWFEGTLTNEFKTISKEDTDLYVVVDNVDEAYETIIKAVDEYCNEQGVC